MIFCSFLLLFISESWTLNLIKVPFQLERNVIYEVDPKFLSVAIDSHVIGERWKNFDFQSRRAKNLAKALAPAYLRLGGTAADLLTFEEEEERSDDIRSNFIPNQDETNETTCWCARNVSNDANVCENLEKLYERASFVMTGQDWKSINKFCRITGLSFLFDLNVLHRIEGRWDSSNARKLFKYSLRNFIRNVTWELGNEPNSFKHVFGLELDPLQLGKDFNSLRNVLDEVGFESSSLVGPDVNAISRGDTKGLKYLTQVLRNGGGVIDAVTTHQYYLNGRTATLEDFLNPFFLNQLRDDIRATKAYLEQSGFYARDLWFGETSSAYGGGAPGLSDRFVAGFLWLDKLGMAASEGYKVVIRQSFYHGCYSLLDETLRPNPDYWISVLYKRLIGTKVLNVTVVPEKLRNHVRLYASFSKSNDDDDDNDNVVVYGMNLLQNDVSLRFSDEIPLEYYILTGELRSKFISLNGKQLRLINDELLPELKPIIQTRTELVLPSYTMFFVKFSSTFVYK